MVVIGLRYLIHFSYDGSDFYGYQKQPGMRTIEGEFEKALYSINNHKITKIFSSGRTDSLVHALSQTAHFDLEINITLYKLKCALNSLLPSDIHVFLVETVDNEFHSRYMATEKTYKYIINCGEYNPLYRKYQYQYNRKLNIEKMKLAIKDFIGTHNFKNFVSEECVKKNYMRCITKASINMKDDIIEINFTGNGFMKYQVRNMVGVLIKIGELKLKESAVSDLLLNRKSNHVFTAPAQGLYLVCVNYDNNK